MKILSPAIAGLLIVLMLIAFVPSNTIDIRLSKQLMAEWAALIFIAIFLIKNVWLKLFFVWSVIRLIISYGGPALGAQTAYFGFNTILYFILFYQALINLKTDKLYYILNAICIATLINAIWLILQYLGIWVLFCPNFNEAQTIKSMFNGLVTLIPRNITPSGFYSGLFSNMNMAASFQALGLVAFLRKRWCYLIPVILASLVMTQTFGGVLPAGVALTIYALVKYKKARIWIIPSIIVGVGIYVYFVESIPQLMEGNLRFELWQKAFKVINVRPIIGWGIEQFRFLFPRIYSFAIKGEHANLKWVFLHNEYLQMWINEGIIGLGLLMGFVISIMKNALKRVNNEIVFIALLGVIVGMINAGGNFLWHTTPGICLLIYIALLDKLNKGEENV